ncbi:MAG: MFS transporter, partial [Spirochaetales bacterium]|nr:MFS transporter [Spirochaetales bacterium]
GISTVEFLWGLGLPLVLESTFLQLFLSKLGASNLIIGFVPTFFFIGQALLGVFAAFYTRNLDKHRTAVIVFHLIPSLTILFFSAYLYITGVFLPSTIYVFFTVYIIFNGGIGLTLPVWQNYVVKLFNDKQVMPAFAVMMILQSAGRLLSSFFIAGFFSTRDITAETSATMFLLCGVLFFAGSFGFLMTREPENTDNQTQSKTGFFNFIKNIYKELLSNRNLRTFLFSEVETYAVITAISFYANYAVGVRGVSEAAAAGIFVGLNYTGQIVSNVIFGTLDFFSYRNKCIISRLCSTAGIVTIIFAGNTAGFLAASVLLGASRAVRSLVYAPVIRLLSGKSDITSHFAAAAIMLLPISTGIPLICGKLLDSLPLEAAVSYRIIFALLAAISLFSITFIRRVSFSSTAGRAASAEG